MKNTSTMTELSEQLKIPRTTLNEWRQQFEEYIPSTGEGRSKRYIVPDALEVFQTIAKLKQTDTSQEDIARLLHQTVPITVQEMQHQEPALFMTALESMVSEMRKSNELKEKELEIRIQEIQEQRLFRTAVMDQLQRRSEEITQALVSIREARQEPAASSSLAVKKRWWQFGK